MAKVEIGSHPRSSTIYWGFLPTQVLSYEKSADLLSCAKGSDLLSCAKGFGLLSCAKGSGLLSCAKGVDVLSYEKSFDLLSCAKGCDSGFDFYCKKSPCQGKATPQGRDSSPG